MKKNIIFNVVILLVISICTSVNAAANAIVTLKADEYQVKQGDTFKVTLSVSCEKGINGIDTTYTYDKTSLELIKAELIGSNKWVDYSQAGSLTILCDSSSKITSADIYEFEFRVKENASVGALAEITIGKTLVDTDEATNSEIEIEAKSINITVLDQKTSSDETVDEPLDEPLGDEKEDGDGQVQPPQSDDKKEEEQPKEDNKEETKPEEQPEEDNKDEETKPEEQPEEDNKNEETKSEEQPEEDNKNEETKPEEKPEEDKNENTQLNGEIENSDKNINIQKNEIDSTIANSSIPKTGNNMLPMILIIGSVLIVISSFIAYKKYKKI